MLQQNCIFCEVKNYELVGENNHSYAIWDKYPVTELHTLVISKKHYETVFDLPPSELESIFSLAKACRAIILAKDSTVQGFNFGTNSGEVAGQKIHHVHFHLIPRRKGDADPPAAKL